MSQLVFVDALWVEFKMKLGREEESKETRQNRFQFRVRGFQPLFKMLSKTMYVGCLY